MAREWPGDIVNFEELQGMVRCHREYALIRIKWCGIKMNGEKLYRNGKSYR